MAEFETDAAGAPIIRKVSSKIGALERRLEYLEDTVGDMAGPAAQFARSEIKAIQGGIAALTYHRAEMEGLDTIKLALSDLVDLVGDLIDGDNVDIIRDTYARAKALLAEQA